MLYIKKIEGAIYSCTHDLARAKLKKAMASLDHCYGLDARGELISPFGRKGIKRALPVVGDVGLAFRRFLEDPFVTFIRRHLSHQPSTHPSP
jgi:hypothetical protein